MEKDINTEVSNTQLPATEEKANLKESLRIQKSQWIKEQIKRQREAEDAVLEQMIEEQRVIDGLNSDINENLDRTRESRKFNQEFQEKINTQIYEMNGITEDKLKGMREYKNAYYQGCAFSLFLLSVVMIGICGVLHGFESQICLFMIACTGVEGALLAQDKWRNKLVNILCKLLYLMVFPVMMVIFVCYELKYPEYDLFLPYFAMGIVVVLIIGTAAFFFYDPYKQDKKRVKNAKDYISEVEKIAKKQVKKNQKLRAKEEKKNQKIQLRTLEREEAAREKEEKLQSKKAEKEARKAEEAAQEELEVTGKLNKVGVSIVVILAAMFLATEISGTEIFSYKSTMKQAVSFFDDGRYTDAYREILGTDLKKKDQETYDKIITVMKVQRSLNSYENYDNMKYYPDALNALLVGLKKYDENIETARNLEVEKDVDSCKEKILTLLDEEYGLSEAQARELLSLKKDAYTDQVVKLGIQKKNS